MRLVRGTNSARVTLRIAAPHDAVMPFGCSEHCRDISLLPWLDLDKRGWMRYCREAASICGKDPDIAAGSNPGLHRRETRQDTDAFETTESVPCDRACPSL